jgi:hypothetical protein
VMLTASKRQIIASIVIIPGLFTLLSLVYVGHLLFQWELNYLFFEYCLVVFSKFLNGYLFIPFILFLVITHIVSIVLWQTSRQWKLLKKFKSYASCKECPQLTKKINELYKCKGRIIVVK